jgi:hypothetical protein
VLFGRDAELPNEVGWLILEIEVEFLQLIDLFRREPVLTVEIIVADRLAVDL